MDNLPNPASQSAIEAGGPEKKHVRIAGNTDDVEPGRTSDNVVPAVDSCVDWTGVKKDSGRAWLVCAAAFSVQVFIVGVLHIFGVFFVDLLEEFQCSKGEAAWVGSIAYGLTMLLAPLSSMIINNYGSHVSTMLGAAICTLSLLMTSWSPNLGVMFVAFSVTYGIGTALAYTPTMTIAGDYFERHFTVATGIMVAGSSTGTLILSPVAQTLIDAMGWRNAMRVLCGFTVLGIPCGYMFTPKGKRPVSAQREIKRSPARALMKDLHLWKNRVFLLWVFGLTLVMFGYFIPYVHLVSHAMELGISADRASILMMVLGGSTAIGRIFFGKIVDYGLLDRLHMQQVSLVLSGTGAMLLPLIKSFGGLIAYVISVGLVDGCIVVLMPVLTTTLVGAEHKVVAWGYLVAISSITFTLGPPTAGWLYDRTGSYDISFHVAGAPIILGAVVLFFIPWAQRTAKSTNVLTAAQSYDVMTQMLSEDEMSCVSDRTPRVATPPEGMATGGIVIDFKPSGTDAVQQRLQHVAHILGGNATAPRDMPMAAPSGADSFAESLAGSLCSRTSSLSIARPRPRPSGSVLVSPAPMSLVVSPKFSSGTGDLDIEINDLMNIQVHSPDSPTTTGGYLTSHADPMTSLSASPRVVALPPLAEQLAASSGPQGMPECGTPLSGLDIMFRTSGPSMPTSLATSPLDDSFVHLSPYMALSSGHTRTRSERSSGGPGELTSNPTLHVSPSDQKQQQSNNPTARGATSEDLIFGAPCLL